MCDLTDGGRVGFSAAFRFDQIAEMSICTGHDGSSGINGKTWKSESAGFFQESDDMHFAESMKSATGGISRHSGTIGRWSENSCRFCRRGKARWS
jgi:hypothetical protein